MDIVRGLDNLGPDHKGRVVAIGNFDGLHLGHQKIIKRTVEEARDIGAKTLALTFDPHPMQVLAPERGVKLIMSPAHRARLMHEMGIDTVLFIPFSREFARTEPEDFIRNVLVDSLGAKGVVVGHGYTFGRAKRGDTEMLRRKGEKYGFKLRVVRHALMHDKPASSSRIRLMLSRGKVAKAATLLGRPYFVEGTVVAGAGRGGPMLCAPTANITPPSNELLPRDGVYATCAHVEGKPYPAAANIGTNPTFHGSALMLEVFLLDYPGDELRGKTLKVEFIERVRDEMEFPSAEALKAQIAKDVKDIRAILANPLSI